MKLLLLWIILSGLAGCDPGNPNIRANTEVLRPAKIMTVTNAGEEVFHEFPARIEALQTVDISFEVGGPLAELPIREGETVSRGALVAALDATDFQLAVREAEVQETDTVFHRSLFLLPLLLLAEFCIILKGAVYSSQVLPIPLGQ